MDYQKFLHAASLLDLDRQARDKELLEMYESARILTDAGDLAAAAGILRQALSLDDHDAKVWHEYGWLLLRQQEYVEASHALLRSITIDSSIAQRHYDFGTGLGYLGSQSPVLRLYVQALGLSTTTADASDSTRFSLNAVKKHLERAIEKSADSPDAQAENYMSLGHFLLAQHDLLASAEAYRKALALAPTSIAAAENLATALELQGQDQAAALVRAEAYYGARRFSDAIRELQYGLNSGNGSLHDYRRLAWSLYYLHRYAEAVEVCKHGTDLFPGARSLYEVWGFSLEQLSQVEEALRVANHATRVLDDPLFMFHERNLMLPVIYLEPSEIERHRNRYETGLERITEQVRNASIEELKRLSRGIVPNFYLGYQGQNSVGLQERYGQVSHKLMSTTYPEYSIPRSMPELEEGGRIRIGYISRHLRQHTVARLFLGWLKPHDRDQFEVYTYHTGKTQDFLSHQIKAASDHYHHLDAGIDEIAKQILTDDLHVLIFLDIGMDSLTMRLANLRLAPIQCAAWGHPVTTGLPTIDYFLSSDLMEPEHADSHYTETLVRLPGISINVPPPYLPGPPRKREEFQLQSDRVLYFAGQSTFKYLPQHDFLLPAIASRVPEAQFIFVASPVPEITMLLRDRLLQAFDQAGLDGRKHITFHESLSPLDYVELMRVCDVFLDSVSWSGGMTTLEAVGCSLPIVTHPGELMRGRHSFGILTQLGIQETIASSLEEYVDIAVRLGKETEWRQSISFRTAAKRDRLFNDRTGLDALETFYKRAVKQRLLSYR